MGGGLGGGLRSLDGPQVFVSMLSHLFMLHPKLFK